MHLRKRGASERRPSPALVSKSTTRWLVRFGYDGRGFYGWARQPGVRTVEGEILRGLHRLNLDTQPQASSVNVASRTDRGVSARANALALVSDLDGLALLRAMNGIAPDVFFLAATPVPEEFSPRSARQRWYRYFEPIEHASVVDSWRAVAKEFLGEIDVGSFGRGIPADRPARRTVDSIDIHPLDGTLRFDIRAPSFVWGMVRKVVSAIRLVVAGALPADQLKAALRGEARLTLPLAEPHGLVLWDVVYDRPWAFYSGRPTRRQTLGRTSAIHATQVTAEILRTAWSEFFEPAACESGIQR